MRLLGLPKEILYLIAENLELEMDLNRFTRTNRLLRGLLTTYLYRNNARHYQSSALHWAAKHAREAVARKSLENGAQPLTRLKPRGPTALDMAVGSGHVGMVKLLLDNTTQTKIVVQSALTMAIKMRHSAMVKLLLDSNLFDLNRGEVYDPTFLQLAAWYNCPEVVTLLLDKIRQTSDDNIKKCSGALHLASRGEREVIVGLLLDAGVFDPLMSITDASQSGHEGLVKLVLDEARSYDQRKELARKALITATDYCRPRVVRYLVDFEDVDPNTADHENRTLLWFVAQLERPVNIETANILLSHKYVEPDLKDRDGRTPLSIAASLGMVDMVNMLLDHWKVDAKSRDNEGLTPIMRAAEAGKAHVVEALRPYYDTFQDRE